ncbi:MAG: hypothetical protein IJH64_00565 [Oscillospiraceae bacterium]|nr:hypothetical protein [Oscillospiraceae bacterium]
MQYIKAEYKELQYRAYVTDALKIIAENTAKYAGGSTLTKRYIEIADDSKPKPQKTAEQIIEEVTKKAGLEVIG